MVAPTLTALALNCTHKPSPEPSSSELIAGQVLVELGKYGVTGATVRVVDHDVGDGDQWHAIRERILDSNIVVLATPTWLGHPSSVARRVLERLDEEERPVLARKVAVVAAVGTEDRARRIIDDCSRALDDVGFTVPAGGGTCWNREGLNPKEFLSLDEAPVAPSSAALAADAAHLARRLAEKEG
jgi:NADPH-dependent FMN reductase